MTRNSLDVKGTVAHKISMRVPGASAYILHKCIRVLYFIG
jgi:hypothetical protein